MIDIQELLRAGEGETLDYKETWSDSCLRTIAAFANTRGGILLLGVDDSGEAVGWGGGDADLQVIANQIVSLLRIQPSLVVHDDTSVRILMIDVAQSRAGVSLRGRYCRRVGSTTQEVVGEELERFLINRRGGSWDAIPEDAPLTEIDEEAVSTFCRQAAQRLPELGDGQPVQRVLENLGLLVEGQLLRGAILLFGRDPQRRFPAARVRMGRFKDSITIVDDKDLGGNLFQQLVGAMRLFRQYLKVRYEIGGQIQEKLESGLGLVRRREIWDFPLDALREAVVNALVHRDYFALNEEVTIRVFDDYMNIRNPGMLPEGLNVRDLLEEDHRTISRNPLLARVFYYANLVERWGTGTTRILRLCRDQQIPDPAFVSRDSFFQVTFAQFEGARSVEELALSDRELRIMRILEELGETHIGPIAERLPEVTSRTIRRDLSRLVDIGVVIAKGDRKNRTYERR